MTHYYKVRVWSIQTQNCNQAISQQVAAEVAWPEWNVIDQLENDLYALVLNRHHLILGETP